MWCWHGLPHANACGDTPTVTVPLGLVLTLLAGVMSVVLRPVVPAAADTPTTAVTAGTQPLAVAVNPVTNKIYVANHDSRTSR